MLRIALTAFVVVAALACSSTEVQESAPAGAINANCPMMGKAINPAVATSDWNGKQVGFCCKGCIKKFAALSDDEKGAKLEATGTEL
ncbi:MAG: hypothetical protein DRQ55_16340 [Planctomycetota bacterium]|nr:MAG: hypothetical protein DRQ55_16340 [Planctomycetota bacterium]